METALPSAVGRYRIDRLLGSGAMGNVYLGRDPELDRAVAIKTLRDLKLEAEAWKTFLERFRNEARAAARLHHPSIVQVYDVGEDPETGPFLVFEYVPGATLRQLLRTRGPLDPSGVIHMARDVAEALDAAHEARIIHRDIKPDNLLVAPDGRTKLADFGVARVPDASLTREGQFLGTPCYAAPETLAQGRYSPQSDLFSFAAVLYEAITGERAFPGDDALAVAQKVINDEPKPASAVARGSKVAPEIDAVLSRGLAKTAEDRFSSAREMVVALHSAYQRTGAKLDPLQFLSSSSGAGEGPRTPKPSGRSGVMIAVTVLTVLCLAVGLIFAFAPGGVWGGEQEPETYDASVFLDDEARTPPRVEKGTSTTEPESTGADVESTPLAGPPDAAVVPVDAGAMTAHDREEAAKDALARARRFIDRQEWPAARDAIEEARRFDPENPDIAPLSAQIPTSP